MIVTLLAILSVSAAAGMRVALPLLVVGLVKTQSFWANVPLISRVHPATILTILTVWSIFELLGSKRLLGQRVLQFLEFGFSPVVGAMLAVTVAQLAEFQAMSSWIVAIVGSVFALILQIVRMAWFLRWGGLPIWLSLVEDVLCVLLVLYAFDAPKHGGTIALLIFWIAIRSINEWKQWYREQQQEFASNEEPLPSLNSEETSEP